MVQLASERVESASNDLRNGMVSHSMSSSRDVAHRLSSSLRHEAGERRVGAAVLVLNCRDVFSCVDWVLRTVVGPEFG